MPNIHKLIPDIHKLLEKGKDEINEEHVQEFFNALREDMEVYFSPVKESRNGRLRMSSIGKRDRQLWYEFNDKSPRKIKGQQKLRFFFGNLVESFLLFLAQEAGHKVTDRQKEVKLEGIKGHIDARIDGMIVDVKSASEFGFRKFKQQKLKEEDPFGYIGQLSGYVQAEGDEEGYFLAYNKNTAEMVLVDLDELLMVDASQRIKDLKKIMKRKTAPEKCYPDKPEGKMGNRSLNTNCTFCDYRYECWSDANNGEGLRVFDYANKPIYLTHVEKEPTVEELLL